MSWHNHKCKCALCNQWVLLTYTTWQPTPEDPEYIHRVCKDCCVPPTTPAPSAKDDAMRKKYPFLEEGEVLT